MPGLKSLEDLFEEQLHDIYYAENKILKAIPKMAKKATDPDLVKGLLKHEKETHDQIAKLERVMESLDIKVKGKKCPAILGIIEEAEEIMKEAKDEDVRDAAIIAAAQKVEHYEIATYGTLCNFAKRLGYTSEGKILHTILEQEKKTDESLTDLANSGINEAANDRSDSERGASRSSVAAE